MNIAGALLLIFGFFLCISIAWATIGFVAMGLGLILLQVVAKRPPIELEEKLVQPNLPDVSPDELAIPSNLASGIEHKEGWELLLKSDSELASVAAVLSRFGSQYVDQLARVYMAINRRELLPAILELIVSAARHDAIQSEAAKLPTQVIIFADNAEATTLVSPAARPPSSLLTGGSYDAAEDGIMPSRAFEEVWDGHKTATGEIATAFPALDFDDQNNLKELFEKLASIEDNDNPFATPRDRSGDQDIIRRT
ncbi:hypothetical protein WHZ77_29660 [Bradyrhizobium sp. A5]|uniref:hypothetical protein n=1 Tax=Bradyrhizobium sp. A5 TaxID=3133696 RepID=UPI0032490E3B